MSHIAKLQALVELDKKRLSVDHGKRFLSKEEYELESVFNREARAAIPAIQALIEEVGLLRQAVREAYL